MKSGFRMQTTGKYQSIRWIYNKAEAEKDNLSVYELTRSGGYPYNLSILHACRTTTFLERV